MSQSRNLTKPQIIELLKKGKASSFVGFTFLPSLSKLKSSELENVFRKAAFIQILSRYGGKSSTFLEEKSERELMKLYKDKLLKHKLTDLVIELIKSNELNKLFFVSTPQNFIIREKDKVPLRKLSILEMENELKKFEKKINIRIKLPTIGSIYREQVEKKITSARLKELCQEKGIIPPKTKTELLKLCLEDTDIKHFVVNLRENQSKNELKPMKELTIKELEKQSVEDKLINTIVKYSFSSNPKYKVIQNDFVAVPIGKYIYKKDLSVLDKLSSSELQKILYSKSVSFSLPSFLTKDVFTTRKLANLVF